MNVLGHFKGLSEDSVLFDPRVRVRKFRNEVPSQQNLLQNPPLLSSVSIFLGSLTGTPRRQDDVFVFYLCVFFDRILDLSKNFFGVFGVPIPNGSMWVLILKFIF